MRILITADPEIPVPPALYGGIERIVDALIKGLAKRGHEVSLCAHPDSKVSCELLAWKGLNSQHFLDTIKNAFHLAGIVYKRKFDVVHSFSRLAYMSGILPLRVPKVMSYQREPTISQVRKAVALSRKGSLCFTGCSDYITNKISAVANAYTVYNCVLTEWYKVTEIVGDDAPLVFLGRIEEIKGPHLAIEIANKAKQPLIIAGNIPAGHEHFFNEKIKPYLNQHIRYIGAVDDNQKNEILGSASALLMPIQWNEPFGIVMAEAMACGTPVLGFPFGSVTEVIDEGVTGFVCTSVDDMVSKIPLCKQINRRSVRRQLEKRFGDDKIVEDYLALYNKIVSERIN
jgi:glycosyltransferase involved in cell wall biosynthesis